MTWRSVCQIKGEGVLCDENCHPQNIAVMKTRAEPLGIEVIVGNPERWMQRQCLARFSNIPAPMAMCVTFTRHIAALHAAKAIGIVAADPLSLTLLKEPGAMGADIAVGTRSASACRGLWRPHAAYMACKDAYKRALPGAIVGVSVDSHGNRAYRLQLANPRATYPPRERPRRNVCTAQACWR